MTAYEFILRLLIMFIGLLSVAWAIDLRKKTDSEFTVLIALVIGASCLVASVSGVIEGVNF